MTDTPEDRQGALEADAIAAAVERLKARREEARLDHTRAGASLFRTLVDPLESAIDLAQKAVSEGRDTSSEGMAFISLPPDFLAVITLKAIIAAVSLGTRTRPISFLPLAKTIGAWCALEYLHRLDLAGVLKSEYFFS